MSIPGWVDIVIIGKLKTRMKRIDHTTILTGVCLRFARRAILPESLYATMPQIPQTGIRINAYTISTGA